MIVNSGSKPASSSRLRADQQGADEEIVPGELVDHANAHSVLGLRAAEQVGDVELVLVGQRQQEIVLQRGRMPPGPSTCCLSHQISFSVWSSRTMNLSLAQRPVCLPVRTTSGPSLASRPSPRRTACSTSGAVVRFQKISAPVAMPWVKPATRHAVAHEISLSMSCGGGHAGLPPHLLSAYKPEKVARSKRDSITNRCRTSVALTCPAAHSPRSGVLEPSLLVQLLVYPGSASARSQGE